MSTPPLITLGYWSHPTWMRGLKEYLIPYLVSQSQVASYVDAWIESPKAASIL